MNIQEISEAYVVVFCSLIKQALDIRLKCIKYNQNPRMPANRQGRRDGRYVVKLPIAGAFSHDWPCSTTD